MWRYRELMPLFASEEPITLGEGWTPLVHARRLGASLGMPRLFVKDESLNPTNSFKARGLSAAVTRAAYLGAKTLSVPSAGNAANAMAAYAAAAGISAKVFMPKDVKVPFIRECELYGADVTLVDGLITDAGRIAAEQGKPLGWYDVSTLKEPYRIEGKKTMAYELGEQLAWTFPDWIIYPTGGGTGMVGMWKAFEEMEAIGWKTRGTRPKMVSVQAEHCAPIVKAFEEGAERSELYPNARTIADGLRVPKAIGDFLVLRAVRESGGTALAVSDGEMVSAMRELGSHEGISAAPEGGAALQALKVLLADGRAKPTDTVVLFNTGGALKYLDVLA
jgi:threonine synthase